MKLRIIHVLCTMAFALQALRAHAEEIRLGVLQATSARAGQLKAAGVQLVVIDLAWDRFEPKAGAINDAYVASVRQELGAFRKAGLEVILDPGVQYPPVWLFDIPESRYRNQYGDRFEEPSPGKNVANSVFNAEVRNYQGRYLGNIFREIGTDFHAVRLGGGWFNELNYPPHIFRDRTNCYWAFDAMAAGSREGLPAGIPASPVPGWKPGEAGADEQQARRFLNWYLDALENYQAWQIRVVRESYPGPLMILYPSWGIRPGQLDTAIVAGLSGGTSPEKNGEIQRGFDFERFVGRIRDPKVILHCTWLDANPTFGDDSSADPTGWSPLHFLGSLAKKHSPSLAVSAENTGGGDETVMRLCAQRVQRYGATMFLWAFEKDLFDEHSPGLVDLSRIVGDR